MLCLDCWLELLCVSCLERLFGIFVDLSLDWIVSFLSYLVFRYDQPDSLPKPRQNVGNGFCTASAASEILSILYYQT